MSFPGSHKAHGFPELGSPAAALPLDPDWRDALAIGPEDDPFWQRIRLAQLRFLQRYLPMNIPVALVNSAIVLASIAQQVPRWVVAYWAITQAAAIILAVRASWQSRADYRAGSEPVMASRRDMFEALVQLAVVGSGWALMFYMALSVANPVNAMLVVAMTIAAMGCLAFSTATWPLGSLAMSGLVAVGTMAGLLSNKWGDGWPVVIVILSFIMFVARGNFLTTMAFLGRMRLQDQLSSQQEVVRLLLNEFEANGKEWLYEFGPDGSLSFASKRFAEVLRRPVEDVIGRPWKDFMTDRLSAQPVFDAVSRGQPFRDVTLKVEVEGEEYWWSLSGTPKFSADGRLLGYRGVGTDVTDRHRAAQRIADLATFDTLTGLVNRRIVQATVEDGLRSEAGVALLFVDLDRFKAVNDSIGHAAGDMLLAAVGQRLRHAVGSRGLVGRLGGDEFAVVLKSADIAQASELGATLIHALSEPYRLGDKSVTIGASIGFATGPDDGKSVEELLRAADLALYDVKGKGRGTVRHYDRELHQRTEQRRALEMDLRHALRNNQIWLAYQPIVDAMDEHVVGFEALMRWRHPVHGEISPAKFIPIAEETGIIHQLGRWALEEACRVAASWPPHLKFSVNLSPMQFDDPELVEFIRRTLKRWKLWPERLELELTESLFLDERPQTSAMLDSLKALGVGFALDDFGTGYSSLGYLQKIAFSRIKIDRSFVQASMKDGGESTAIIQAIVALAGRLGMETTAEGTETRAEFEAMRRLGCAQVQGFLFGRPMPAVDVERLLARRRPLLMLEDLDPDETDLPVSQLRAPSWPAGNARSQVAAAPANPPSR